MSSRQEQKAARKAEREAQEAKAAKAAARKQRLQLVLGAVLVLAIIGGSIYGLTQTGSDSSTGDTKNAVEVKAKLPPVAETNLTKAASLAKCTLTNPTIEGSTHVEDPVTYKSNPPTSGNHNPVAASDGIYDPGNEPAKENVVHALEHGRVELQYKPGTPAKAINELETVGSEELNGSPGYKILVFENPTRMPFAVAATAWGHLLGCKTMNPQAFDAIRAFRKEYTDKGPEQGIPPT